MTHRERNRRWATSHGRRLARRRTYGAMVDAGVCVTCQAAPAAHDRVRCPGCGEAAREAKRKARQRPVDAPTRTIATTPSPSGGVAQNGAPSARQGQTGTASGREAVR